MVVQLSEQSTSSLPASEEPNVSKVPALETATVSREISRAGFIVSSSSSSLRSRSRSSSELWANCVASILSRTDELGQYVSQFLAFLASKLTLLFFNSERFIYKEAPLSAESTRQLQLVSRKILVLDLDETLVHSCYVDPESNEIVGCNFVPPTAVPDYVMSIPIVASLNPIEFQVYKRPHVDQFLDFVSKWYDVVIYTASMESYASTVVDKLDAGRGIFQRRFYRQHCTSATNFVSKNLYMVDRDLTRVFIIDNSPTAYRDFPQNAIPIKTYIYDPADEELLNLLPFLDALRFTKDVRSILGRRVSI
ncbi:CTD nuclear envelope phosphatase 1 homolog [Drosophila innubila]|uniref:CTD nuclear envelope phosphatase 1 homolog n=1 Tax=Drosophila innubila TaxID=198719 RepID=UPI00148B691F|nr:CTD nuclear envelope phosphatase 1 homolog [Drosophila innubila]